MATRIWSHLCDYASIDGNGKPMIIGEFENINSKTVPTQHPMMFVITKWMGSPGEVMNIQVKVMGTNRDIISETAISTITFSQGTKDGISYHISIDLFIMPVFKKFGEHSVEIVLNNIPIHFLPLTVQQQ